MFVLAGPNGALGIGVPQVSCEVSPMQPGPQSAVSVNEPRPCERIPFTSAL